MKKIIFVLSILPILTGCATLGHKQFTIKESNPDYKTLNAFENDTLEYVKQNFYENQQFYTGKPLSVLFNDLEANIVHFTPSHLFNPMDKSDAVDLTIRYTKHLESPDKSITAIPTVVKLIVKFTELYSRDAASEVSNYDAEINWGKAQEDFYKNFIVKEIFIYIPKPE